MLKVGPSNMTHPADRDVLLLFLDAGEASQANVEWGSGHRNVVIFTGKKYQYKGAGSVNKILMKSNLPLYISMSSKVLIKNKITDDKKQITAEKNNYVHELIGKLQQLNAGNVGSVRIILTYVSVKQALKFIQQNIQNKKLALKPENNKYYFLNDHTINKSMKGLIDENTVVQLKD